MYLHNSEHHFTPIKLSVTRFFKRTSMAGGKLTTPISKSICFKAVSVCVIAKVSTNIQRAKALVNAFSNT